MTTCPNCRAGKLRRRTINYANLPAWSCDAYAFCQIDLEALQRLLPLIGPVTRPNLAQVRRAPGTAPPIIDLPEDADPDRDRRAA